MSGWMIFALLVAILFGFFVGALFAVGRLGDEILEHVAKHTWKTCREICNDFNEHRTAIGSQTIAIGVVKLFLEMMEDTKEVQSRFRSLVDIKPSEEEDSYSKVEYKKKTGGVRRRIKKVKAFRVLIPGHT